MEKYIKNEKNLKELCSHLKTVNHIAVDTEFVRDSYYYPRIGIIQVASPEFSAIIDPLEVKDLSSFLEILQKPDITKIFHAAKEDIAVIYSALKIIPSPVFDTQIAAALAGYEESISYAKLVKYLTGVKLSKKETYTDWLKRPLSNSQIKYALNDVIYLIKLYEKLHEELKDKKRLSWAEEEFKKTEREKSYKPKDIKSRYSKMLHYTKLGKSSFNVLIEILEWREKKAKELDRTRKHILKDDVIMNIAKICPSSKKELELVPGFFSRNIKKYGNEILNSVKKGKKNKEVIKLEKYPSIPSGLVNLLTTYIKTKADEENIAYGAIATRDDIEKFIYRYLFEKDCKSPLMDGWRKTLVGEDLKKIVDGKVGLKFSRKSKAISIMGNQG